MSRKTKIWLIIGSSLILMGCLIFGGAMGMLKWDFQGLSTVDYESNNYNISDSYRHISIISGTADITLVASENGKHSVSCYEEKNAKHSISVKNETLVIELANEKKWYEYIGVNFGTPKITITIPQGEYGEITVKASTGNVEIPESFRFECLDISVSTGKVKNLASVTGDMKIKTSTGGIHLENVSAKSLILSGSTGKITANAIHCEEDIFIHVSTGKVSLRDVQCVNLSSDGSTGDLYLTNVIASEKYSIKRNTGDVTLESCDAAEIQVKTTTGKVTGTLLTDKLFITESNTGKIRVPQFTTGGKCNITTDTGNIVISIT